MNFIEALQKGDSKKINEIYNSYFPIVRSIVLKNNGSVSEARDIFQEALIAILVNYKDVNIDFKNLLLRISKNKWIDQLRSRKIKSEIDIVVENDQSIEDTLIQKEKEDQQFTILENNLNKLSELCQQLLQLIKKGTPVEEIVEKLNMTNANTIYRRKFACMKKWKELVANDPQYKMI
ncbi:MAG: sigma-70 family RNA polymerase sigma factor [Saprospiraceae bacterium]|nr:sigma-70 family RNA polymerase sigma factor [Saprospiraceae bacterium]